MIHSFSPTFRLHAVQFHVDILTLIIMNFVLLMNIYESKETECVGCTRGN